MPISADPSFYDWYLEMQSDLSFGAELAFYYREPWLSARRILDLGCGNGSYLRRLATRFPEKSFVGIDIDEQLLVIAQNAGMPANVELACASFEDLSDDFDILTSRLCTIYLNDFRALARWADRHVSHGLINIGPHDSLMVLEGELTHYRQLLRRLDELSTSTGGSRNAANHLATALAEVGFRRDWQHDVVVTTEPPYSRAKMYHFMQLTAELLLGATPSAEVQHELFRWFMDPSRPYSQFAHHADAYTRKERG